MRPLAEFPPEPRRRIATLLCDIDDTLTREGRLPAESYAALESLNRAGLRVIPVTGRPAGWCDLIARFWPVDALVGENGAFYFRYDHARRRMLRRYWKPAPERARDRARLERLGRHILARVEGAALAADQPYRESDLAIDYAEDVPPLDEAALATILRLFEEAGARAKVSSIHVNGWFGDYDKLAMTTLCLRECFGIDAEAERSTILFVGDSPNDAPMFGFFPHAVGVANLRRFAGRLDAEPAFITPSPGAQGFVELAHALLAARS